MLPVPWDTRFHWIVKNMNNGDFNYILLWRIVPLFSGRPDVQLNQPDIYGHSAKSR